MPKWLVGIRVRLAGVQCWTFLPLGTLCRRKKKKKRAKLYCLHGNRFVTPRLQQQRPQGLPFDTRITCQCSLDTSRASGLSVAA